MRSNAFLYLIFLFFGWFAYSQAPTVTGNSNALEYTEGDGAVVIDDTVTPKSGQNSGRLTSGHVAFTQGFNSDEDSIYIDLESSPVEFSYQADIGRIDFTKGENEALYETAMKAIKYINKSANPSTTNRVIEFVVSDSKSTSTPFVRTISIIAVNTAPWFYEDNTSNQVDTLSFTTLEDQEKDITPTIFDPEGNDYTLALIGLTNNSGTVTINDGAKSFKYVPNTNFASTEYVSIRICETTDTSVCRESVVKITVSGVNDLPFMYDGSTDNPTDTLVYQGTEDVVLTVCPTISDPDGDALEVNVQGVENGNGSTTSSSDKLCFDFTPTFNFNGVEYINIEICEKSGAQECVKAVIKVNVAAVNDAPYLYTDNTENKVDTLTFLAVEDEVKTVTPTVTDPEGEDYAISLVGLSKSSGEVVISEDKKSMEYTPNLNFNGNEFVVIELCEANDDSNCNEAVIKLEVEPVNDAPIVQNNGVAVDSLYFGININEVKTVTLDVTDLEGDNASISSVEGPYQLGEVDSIVGLSFRYTPGKDLVGSEYLKVFVCDDAAVQKCDSVIVQIQFPIVNTAPVFQNINQEDTISRGVLVAETLRDSLLIVDDEGDGISIDTSYLLNTNGEWSASFKSGYLIYELSPSATDSVTSNTAYCKMCDDRSPPLCDSVWIDIAINYPPTLLNSLNEPITNIADSIFVNDSSTLCFNLFDLNDQSVFNSSITSSGNGTLTANPDNQSNEICLYYEPVTDFIGREDFSIELCDNGSPASCTEINVSYFVFETNTPNIEGLDSLNQELIYNIQENDSLSACLQISDMEGDSLFIKDLVYLSGPGELNAELNQTDSTLCLQYIPEIYAFGTYEASLIVCDDNAFQLCDTVPVQINLEPFNLEPLLVADNYQITELGTYEFDILSNDTDPEDEGLFISDVSLPEIRLGEVMFTEDFITYEPFTDEYKGIDSLRVTICDRGIPEVCSVSELNIELLLPVPELEFFEAFSPNGDGINDTWFIDGIREFPDNVVRILDQYGRVVFEVQGYDNRTNIWEGERDRPGTNSQLDDGTYYYSIDLGNGRDPITGFVIIRR